MNTPFSRPGALAKIFGFGLTLATTVLAGAALEPQALSRSLGDMS